MTLQEGILTHLAELVACDTQNPPRRLHLDDEVFAVVRRALEAAGGFQVVMTDHGAGRISLYAVRGQPRVLFNAHLDTVPVGEGWDASPLLLRVEEARAIGRGACDIKGGAAVLLALAASTAHDLALLFTTDEESDGGRCVQAFCAQHAARYDLAVVAEPTSAQPVTAHRGYLSAHAAFTGRAGHSSEARALDDNAIHKAMAFGHAAVRYAQAEADAGRGICLNVGSIRGGVADNVIAEEAELLFSLRLPPGGDNDSALETLRAQSPRPDTVRFTPHFSGPPLPSAGRENTDADAAMVRAGLSLRTPVDFWTEASLFAAAGVPAVVLGPGNIEQAHTANEWVSLAQLSTAYRCYIKIIEAMEHTT